MPVISYSMEHRTLRQIDQLAPLFGSRSAAVRRAVDVLHSQLRGIEPDATSAVKA